VTGRAPDELPTARLLLRRWRAGDREPLAAIGADVRVMRHIGSGVLDRAGSDALVARLEREWRERGHGVWALERRADGALLGFCGLTAPAFAIGGLGGERAVEIGWRLRHDAWGHGYAFEASTAAVGVAWRIGLRRLVCLVHPENERSLALAERLGMRVAGTTVVRRPSGEPWRILVLRLDRPEDPPAGGGPGGMA